MSVSRIHRLLRLITLLQGGRRYTAADLARELEVSKRTIFRDLNMLELAGIPHHFDPEKGGYTIRQRFFLSPINLTFAEGLSMLMLASRGRGIGRGPLMTHAARAAMKVESALPASIRQHVGGVRIVEEKGPEASLRLVERLRQEKAWAAGVGIVAEREPSVEDRPGATNELAERARELRRKRRLEQLTGIEEAELVRLHAILDQPTEEELTQLRVDEKRDHDRFRALLDELESVSDELRRKANGKE